MIDPVTGTHVAMVHPNQSLPDSAMPAWGWWTLAIMGVTAATATAAAAFTAYKLAPYAIPFALNKAAPELMPDYKAGVDAMKKGDKPAVSAALQKAMDKIMSADAKKKV